METALASLAIGLLMLQLVRVPFDPKPRTAPAAPVPDGAVRLPRSVPQGAVDAVSYDDTSLMRPRILKLPILLAALAILATTLLGYIRIGHASSRSRSS